MYAFCFPKKMTHFYMRQKAETSQTYRGTPQTKGENLKPRKFCPWGSEMGDGVLFVQKT
jgi:hypothetical protein